jgi:hypothetical protein
MPVSRIDRRFGAPSVRMVLPPRNAILSAFAEILSRGFRISQYACGPENRDFIANSGHAQSIAADLNHTT